MKRGGRWTWLLGATLVLAMAACRTKPAAHAQSSAPQAAVEKPSNPADIAVVRRLLDEGKALMRSGQGVRAEPLLQQAVQFAAALTPSDPSLLSEALAEHASCLVLLKRLAEARPLIQDALPLVQRGTVEGQKREFQLLMTLAESYRYEGRNDFALAPFRAALQASSLPRYERELVNRHTEAAARLATTLQQLGRHAEATQVLEEALAMAQRNEQPADSSRLTMQLAFSYLQLGDVTRTVTMLQTIGAHGRRLRTSDMTFSDVALDDFLPAPAVPEAPAPPSTPQAPPPAPSSTTTSPAVARAAQRVDEMRSDFQRCYQSALATNSLLQGASRLIIKLAADGHVAEAKALAVSLPVEMVECLLRHAVAANFDPPDGGAAVIVVPVTFVKRD